ALNRSLNRAFGVDERPDPDGPHKTVGFHLFNILIHLACGLLLFGLVRRASASSGAPALWSSRTNEIALVVTALWLLHPIQTEAVDYVIERTELLVSVFYVLVLYASLRAWTAATRRSLRRWQ